MISSFTGEFAWASNFYEDPFLVEALGRVPSLEHAYQACKGLTEQDRRWVLQASSPAEAKRRGRQLKVRPGWDEIKRPLMLRLVLTKFCQSPGLGSLLVGTRGQVLVEGNDWGDTFWGAVRSGARGFDGSLPRWPAATVHGDEDSPLFGHNWLGRCLMMTRDVLS